MRDTPTAGRTPRMMGHSGSVGGRLGRIEADTGKELVPAARTLSWEHTTDEYGDVRMLRLPDMGSSAFRSMP